MIHLKHLGSIPLQYLTNVFNLSLSSSTIPSIWKQSTIIPLLKPGKSVTTASHTDQSLSSAPPQRSLKNAYFQFYNTIWNVPHINTASRHSTVTAHNELATAVANGFNQKQPADRTLSRCRSVQNLRHRVAQHSANASDQLKPARSTGSLAEHIHAW